MSRAHVHPIPWACRIFGHQMHNALARRHGGGAIFAEDFCYRDGCPGPDHAWSEFEPDPEGGPDDYVRHCTVDGCTETWRLQVPDMSGDGRGGPVGSTGPTLAERDFGACVPPRPAAAHNVPTDPTYFGTCTVCNGWLPHDDVGDMFCKMGVPDHLVGDARIATAKLLTLGLSKEHAALCVVTGWGLFGADGIVGTAIFVDRIATIFAEAGLMQRLERRS